LKSAPARFVHRHAGTAEAATDVKRRIHLDLCQARCIGVFAFDNNGLRIRRQDDRLRVGVVKRFGNTAFRPNSWLRSTELSTGIVENPLVTIAELAAR